MVFDNEPEWTPGDDAKFTTRSLDEHFASTDDANEEYPTRGDTFDDILKRLAEMGPNPETDSPRPSPARRLLNKVKKEVKKEVKKVVSRASSPDSHARSMPAIPEEKPEEPEEPDEEEEEDNPQPRMRRRIFIDNSSRGRRDWPNGLRQIGYDADDDTATYEDMYGDRWISRRELGTDGSGLADIAGMCDFVVCSVFEMK
ncbi:hypothetical protein B0T26DRAFT_752898 [Lasiosphaeria miniovina]|uniref:Uncharacterized protein n=1 Tax=Lasiosphaeria miniovina TaxID=1954250 RepID=A0AA40DUW5_9PEZI|nr:uncharacterized protein B0T26DRAFT_752898 [Lasiosphaeria miniovina]KAK0712698.1 hypothetical protein B0T26DRAFT_752898 [Lasiosphaeria miniovina]